MRRCGFLGWWAVMVACVTLLVPSAFAQQMRRGVSHTPPLLATFLIPSAFAQEAQQRGWLGVVIQSVPPALHNKYPQTQGKGVLIVDVMRGEPADRAGLRRNDLVLSVADRPISEVSDLQATVAALPVGSVVPVEFLRDGLLQTVQVKVADASQRSPMMYTSEGTILFWLTILVIFLFFLMVYLIGRFLTTRRVRASAPEGRRNGPVLRRPSRPLTLTLLTSMALVVFLGLSFRNVPAGHRAVVFNLFGGLAPEPLLEGLHFLIPIVNRVRVYDVRTHTYSVVSQPRSRGPVKEEDTLWAPTAEGFKLGLNLSVRYRPDPARLVELHRQIGADYQAKVVLPTIRNVVRIVLSGYTTDEIIATRRGEAEAQIMGLLRARFSADGIICEDVLIRDLFFTEGFEQAVQRKLIAEQRAQQLEFEVEQARVRAEARVVEAEGEAGALELVSEQLEKNPNLLRYVWNRELASKVQVMVVPREGGPARRLGPEILVRSEAAGVEAPGVP